MSFAPHLPIKAAKPDFSAACGIFGIPTERGPAVKASEVPDYCGNILTTHQHMVMIGKHAPTIDSCGVLLARLEHLLFTFRQSLMILPNDRCVLVAGGCYEVLIGEPHATVGWRMEREIKLAALPNYALPF